MPSQLHIPADMQSSPPTEGLHMPTLPSMTPDLAHKEMEHAQTQIIETNISKLHLFYNHHFLLINAVILFLVAIIIVLAVKRIKDNKIQRQKQNKLNTINHRIMENGE